MKKVTDQQLATLIQFIRSKGVKHYDIRMEVVDHFASAIEEKWETRPDLSFEQEMVNIYHTFGDIRFLKLIHSKKKAMEKQWLRNSWRHFKAFFTLPKLVFSLILVVLTQQVLQKAADPIMVFWFCGSVVILSSIIISVLLYWKKPVKVPVFSYDRAYWLQISAIHFALLFFFQLSDLLVSFLFIPLGIELWGAAILLSSGLLFFYSMVVHVSWKHYQEFQRQYSSIPLISN